VEALIRKQSVGFIPAHKENNHERGRTKKFPSTQKTKEAPCFEKVHGGEKIKSRDSSKRVGKGSFDCVHARERNQA